MEKLRNRKILTAAYYQQENVVAVARDLIGKLVFTNTGGQLTGGIITETEAYGGVTDKASHAYGGRLTDRTSIMFREGGLAYIYLCYGVHSLFNIVTNVEGIPHAILIRGIYPIIGTDIMMKRAGKQQKFKQLGSGPGKVSKILGLHYSLSGTSLLSDIVWLEESRLAIPADYIKSGPRIGVDYAGEDALLEYRFFCLILRYLY